MQLYAFRLGRLDRPAWAPLRTVAAQLARRPDVPNIRPEDFVWTAELRPLDGGPKLHLYRHVVTRMFLNLDADGNGYVFVDGETDSPLREAVVYFRRSRSLASAIDRLRLDDTST